jgi:ankyrin repeat protein
LPKASARWNSNSDMDPFADFMGASPTAKAPTSAKSLWPRLVRAAQDDSGDAMPLVASAFPAAHVVEFRDEHQRTVTHLAVLIDNLELLEFALESGASLDACDDCGASPLTTALVSGHFRAADMLVTYGCDVDHCNPALQTALHVLATYGALDAVQWLLERGADVEARDAGGNSPLHLAAAYCSLPVVELLLAAGADVNVQNASGATPLHFAAPNGNYAVVATLIESGGDVESRDEHGNTPLIDAAFVSQHAAPHFASGDQTTQHAVIELLLQHGADVNAVNRDGDSALFGAVHSEYDAVVKLLLVHGADARVRNNQQETLLHVLARGYASSAAIWRELLQHEADILAQDRRNLTCAMVWASRHQGSPSQGNGDSVQQKEVAWIERVLSREPAVGPAH